MESQKFPHNGHRKGKRQRKRGNFVKLFGEGSYLKEDHCGNTCLLEEQPLDSIPLLSPLAVQYVLTGGASSGRPKEAFPLELSLVLSYRLAAVGGEGSDV